MFDFDDPWWAMAVVLVLILWIMGAIIPVRIYGERIGLSRFALEAADDASPEADLPPPPRRPSLLLPVLVFLLSLGLMALSLTKRVKEPEGGARWTWLIAAAGMSFFWSIILMTLTVRLR
jgi:hypothetical protein